MSTAAVAKTPVKTTWTTEKIQEAAAAHAARQFGHVQTLIQKFGPEAGTSFQQAQVEQRVHCLKDKGVKTPLELVQAMAEFETNLFGSKISVWGDEKTASMQYEVCACYEAMKKELKLTPQQDEQMGHMFAKNIELIGKEFGFKGEVKFDASKEACAVITFTK